MKKSNSAEELVIEERLASIGQRFTSGRRELVANLLKASQPLSVEDLQEKNTIPQSSLYRNLVVLEEAGVVRRVETGTASARYELSEAVGDHHHHAICRVCERVFDVELKAADEEALEQISRRVSRSLKFTEEEHRLDLLGVCSSCISR